MFENSFKTTVMHALGRLDCRSDQHAAEDVEALACHMIEASPSIQQSVIDQVIVN